MPVEEYAARLAVARRLELATIAGDNRRKRLTVLSRYAAFWSEAVDKLQRFRQPASGGWAADVLYAQMMQTAAMSAVAGEAGNDALARALTERKAEFAQRHFDRRLADLDIGRASLAQVAESLSHLRRTAVAADVAKLSETDLTTLDSSLQTSARKLRTRIASLHEEPAGVSRRDALQRIRYELAMAAAHGSKQDRDAAGLTSNLNQAYQAAGSMFSAQQRSYPTGTASLADLTHAWRLREVTRERMREGKQDGVGKPFELQSQLKAELDRLLILAGSLADSRGRNSADILFVSGLSALEQWKTIQADRQAKAVQHREGH